MIYAIIAIIIFFTFYFLVGKKIKSLDFPCVTIFTGGVKCGKTTLAVRTAIKKYRLIHLKWWIKTKIFRKDKEEPLLYSNIPLSVPHVRLTQELLLRQKRFNYGSVVLCSEASLVADSQYFRDKDFNDTLTLFNKLFGHETGGIRNKSMGTGYLIYDSQNLNDLHYSIKRVSSTYYFIQKCIKWIPFILVFNVREMTYVDDTTINVYNEDSEDTMKKVIILKKWWKKFDSCCYSILTDNKSIENKIIKVDNLKTTNIVGFRNWHGLERKIEENEKEINNNFKENN